MKVKILISLTILILATTSLFLYFKGDKKYNECAGMNIADWSYSGGKTEYETCVDKNDRALFTNYQKAFEKMHHDNQDLLNYIKDNYNLKEISIDNYDDYLDACKDIAADDNKYQSDCEFLDAFFIVYSNNFIN